jgi:putative NADH-flavin reductase
MKLTIVAATGGIGRLLVDQAVAAGHDVTAVVRNPAKLTAPVRVVRVDLNQPDPAALVSAMSGADAVLSGLGPRARAEMGVATRGTRAVIDAMKQAGCERILVVSAAPIGTVASPANPNPPRYDPGDNFLMRHVFSPAIKAVVPKHYADLAAMEDELRASGLQWTVIRPPKLTDKPVTAAYRIAYGRNILGGFTVSRADVAHLMLRLVTEPASIGQTVGVAN